MDKINLDGIKYIGADIVPALIEKNKTNYSGVDFQQLDILNSKLPMVDVIFCRDCLVHFSFDDIIENLSNEYKEINFLVTNDSLISNDNVFYTKNIIGLEKDLFEISYLSTFCDVIIGRSSGPHSFSYIKDNFFNKKKINISICSFEYDGRWFYEVDCNNIWTDNYDEKYVLNLIKKEIEEL